MVRVHCLSDKFCYFACKEEKTNTVIVDRNDYPFKRKKIKDVYRETLEREERIRALGFRSIFEHDFHKLCQTKEMKEFLSRYEITCSIGPRDAFFGGCVLMDIK